MRGEIEPEGLQPLFLHPAHIGLAALPLIPVHVASLRLDEGGAAAAMRVQPVQPLHHTALVVDGDGADRLAGERVVHQHHGDMQGKQRVKLPGGEQRGVEQKDARAVPQCLGVQRVVRVPVLNGCHAVFPRGQIQNAALQIHENIIGSRCAAEQGTRGGSAKQEEDPGGGRSAFFHLIAGGLHLGQDSAPGLVRKAGPAVDGERDGGNAYAEPLRQLL